MRLLSDLEDADGSVSGASSQPKGRLRVDVPSPIARMLLMPALPAFHARYPDIQLDMGVSDRNIDVIGDNVDCVLRGGELRVFIDWINELMMRHAPVAAMGERPVAPDEELPTAFQGVSFLVA